ncbi:MAG: NAD(P)H-binding protein [Alphaproteobacteria bacterium]|nr:NAD(P)H-binding protein [Alphaproteobacteria bacterium]
MNKLTYSLSALLALAFAALPLQAKANTGVLVFGGTGQLGAEIVMDLRDAGEDVTVFVRPTSDRSQLEPLGVSFVTGDVLTEADVEAALKAGPFRVVVDALARDGDTKPDFYIDSMRYISKWAQVTGVSQVILHGSVGAGLSRPVYPDERWDVMGPTITAKDYGERHLMESGAPYTIIRNLVLLPAEIKESGVAAITTDQSKRGVVTRDGLARLTIVCLDNPSCINEIYHAYDEEVEPPGRYKQIMEEFKKASN